MAAALGIGRFVYTPILPSMIDALAWSKADAGLVASSNFLGYVMGALAVARLGMAGRQRAWLLAALVVSALTSASMAFATHLAVFAGLRLLSGIASAFVIVIASTLVLNRLATARQGHLSAVHFAGVGAGIVLSAAMVSLLQAEAAGWPAQWIGSGLISLLATLAVAVLVPADAAEPTVVAASTVAVVTPGRHLAMFVLAYGLFGFGYVITTTFLVTIVRLTPGVQNLEAWIWILVGLAAMPSVMLWSRLGQRLGLMAAFAIACLAQAVGVLASVEWVTPIGVGAAAILLGGTFMGQTALGLMGARQLSGAQSQRALGLMTASFAIGQMIGPTVAGHLFDRLGSFRGPSLLAAVALILAAGLAILAGRGAAAAAVIAGARPAGPRQND